MICLIVIVAVIRIIVVIVIVIVILAAHSGAQRPEAARDTFFINFDAILTYTSIGCFFVNSDTNLHKYIEIYRNSSKYCHRLYVETPLKR